jgi:multisubunit Na+/H+ antiporter MnhB subunit
MSMIVQTVSEWVRGFILLYGIYIMLYGHTAPGGGFAGGAIAAAAFLLIMLSGGRHEAEATFSRQLATISSSLGALLFWLMAILGVAATGIFFANFWEHFIEVCEASIGLLVCSALYLVLRSLQTTSCTAPADPEGDTP